MQQPARPSVLQQSPKTPKSPTNIRFPRTPDDCQTLPSKRHQAHPEYLPEFRRRLPFTLQFQEVPPYPDQGFPQPAAFLRLSSHDV